MQSYQPHLPFVLLYLLHLSIVKAQGTVQTFWADYPPCEETCHENVFNSQQCTLENSCSGCSGCLCLADSCLCETSSWLIAVAQCIGQSCGAADVTTAASIVQSACDGKGFTLAVGSAALVSYGMAAIPTPTQVAAGTTKTAQPQVVTVTNTPAVSGSATTPQASTAAPPLTTSQASTTPPSTQSTQSSTTSATSSATAELTPASSSSQNSDTSSTSRLSTTLSPTSSSTSYTTSSTPTQPSSSDQPSSGLLASIILPSIIGGIGILVALFVWIAPDAARRYFRNVFCCCCLGDSDEDGARRDLRGAASHV